MPNCTSCSAPLPKSGIICKYCGTRNDIDLLEDTKKFINLRPDLKRVCPVCKTQLKTINVGEKLPLFIERCDSCYGVFFDINELEELIEYSVKGSKNVDLKKLFQITQNPRYIDIVVYRKCPVCTKTMNRKNFMGQSGVITDICAEHGIWLDSGELRQIMEWVKTGGLSKVQKSVSQEEATQNFRLHSNKKDKISAKKSYEESDLFETIIDILFSRGWY
jgi:Zn-finger nucleic acid-binding protein